MTLYAKSAYHDAFPNGVPQPSRSAQGWGSGWPHCQSSKMKTVVGQDQTPGQNFDIRVTVRSEIAEMVGALLEATDKLYDLSASSTGGYNCRPIAGTNTASNHSWGLAIDLNWNDNPYTAKFTSHIPPAVVAMWVACGWGWGGFYKGGRTDTMHFEYLGKPSDVAKDTQKALSYNNPIAIPVPKPKPTYVATLGKNAKPGKVDPTNNDLQRALIAAGYAKGIFTAPNTEGLYGAGTEQAVRKFFDKHPEFQSSATDTAIGAKGWTALRKQALAAS